MDEKYVEAFRGVTTFVNDLWGVFGDPKKCSPLSLYRRLIDHIQETDADDINKALSGFRQFLASYEDAILHDKLDSIPRGTIINYGSSQTVYLEIQKYIHQTRSDIETREAIRHHLITISAILEPNGEKMEELEKKINGLQLDENTREGAFIGDIMREAKSSVQGVDTNDPSQAIMGLLGSGVIQKMVTGIGSGEMDMHSLLGSMQTAIGALMPPRESVRSSVEEITDDVQEETEK